MGSELLARDTDRRCILRRPLHNVRWKRICARFAAGSAAGIVIRSADNLRANGGPGVRTHSLDLVVAGTDGYCRRVASRDRVSGAPQLAGAAADGVVLAGLVHPGAATNGQPAAPGGPLRRTLRVSSVAGCVRDRGEDGVDDATAPVSCARRRDAAGIRRRQLPSLDLLS